MTTATEITEKVTNYLSGDYEIADVDQIPSVEDVEFGKYAKRIKLCTLSIDLRNSTSLLFNPGFAVSCRANGRLYFQCPFVDGRLQQSASDSEIRTMGGDQPGAPGKIY
ncbi:MAG: hypothetical protein C0401_11285 [Anaerolinea sp.]|nr:hypothetical protein [Anaerolinea sp.]